MSYIVQTRDLTKEYGGRKVVDNINLSISEGQIYGLIGVNGAGKTSLMRMLCGLAKPTDGSIFLFGNSDIHLELKKVGHSIEQPALYPHFSAYENMMAHALLIDAAKKKRIFEYLSLVGLDDTNKKVRNYSLGMKQRLMIALTLLGKPCLLILDEPMNGLDPVSMKNIRELLIKINRDYGVTIIISSHILDELSKISDIFGIMESGRLIKEVTKQELQSKSNNKMLLEVNDVKKTIEILRKDLQISYFTVNDNTITLDECNSQEEKNAINLALLEHGISIIGFTPKKERLEDYFLKVMREIEND